MTLSADDPLAWRLGSRPPKEWSIAIYRGASLETLAPVDGAVPALTAAAVDDVAASFVADPFFFLDDGRWYLFFEALNIAAKNGEIAVASSADGVQWQYRGIVLSEPFHLSYPHVFRRGSEIFMTPESIEARSVRLYRAVEFPFRWQFEATLIDDVYADPTPFEHDGAWWLFGSPRPMGQDVLSLFRADDIHGPWIEHPCSPVVRGDRSRARPAGRVQRIDGRLIRFAQDCNPVYGNGVRAFVIETLTRDDYRERELAPERLLSASGRGWNRDGMHHIDLQPSGGGWLACVDGYTVVPDSPPRIEVLHDLDAVDAIASEWSALLEGTRAHRVCSSYPWYHAACLAEPSLAPLVLIAYRHDRITGILPLVRDDHGAARFAAAMSGCNDVIAFDAETGGHLLDAARALSLLDLRYLAEESMALAALRGRPGVTIDTDIDCYTTETSRLYRATFA
ncbi:MAG TPA: hypothetical protein VLC46_03910 [Thermoanaerobaculia bacterium]|nr:hypothetical protein [Thermoanaerobaculia bacterium]